MLVTKKDIPLELLKAIEPIAQENLELIKLTKEENTYYSFIETDSLSNNYFKIYVDCPKHIKKSIYDGYYYYENKPKNESSTNIVSSSIGFSDVVKNFEKWLDLIKSLDNQPSLHDDNFLKKYSDYYYEELKIVDEDAYYMPFDPKQQDKIELVLISLKDTIHESGNSIDDNVKQELIQDIEEINNELSTTTKNIFIKRFVKIIAKLRKLGTPIAKEIIHEIRKNLVKKFVDFGIKYGGNLLDVITS